MKNSISILGLMFLAVFLCAGTSFAGTYTFYDTEVYWEGYKSSVNGYNVEDDLSDEPMIEYMQVEFDDASKKLNSVSIFFAGDDPDDGGRILFDSLFISNDDDGYKDWDYYIIDGNPNGDFGLPKDGAYIVQNSETDPYTESIVETMWDGREGHINGIKDNVTKMDGFNNGTHITYTDLDTDNPNSGSVLTYDFSAISITLGNDWRIGYAPYCANDVISGSPVPEPATLLLLGSGLLGFAGLRRKKTKQQ